MGADDVQRSVNDLIREFFPWAEEPDDWTETLEEFRSGLSDSFRKMSDILKDAFSGSYGNLSREETDDGTLYRLQLPGGVTQEHITVTPLERALEIRISYDSTTETDGLTATRQYQMLHRVSVREHEDLDNLTTSVDKGLLTVSVPRKWDMGMLTGPEK